jgi:TrmH family RNA methyltransferase
VSLSQNRRRLLGRLRVRRQREREGAVLVEGVRAVGEALSAGARPSFSVTSPRLSASAHGPALRERLTEIADVTEVEDDELDALSDTDHPQGVLAVFPQPAPELAGLPEAGTVLVLDAVQDPGNVGTLVRSAVAFGLDGVLTLDGTVDPWGAKAVRASAGAVFRIPVWRATLPDTRSVLSDRRADVLVAAADGGDVREALDPAAGLRALVLGNEGAGVRDEIRDLARAVVAVPMRGAAESLNVGVAGSILMYECMRATES